MKHSASLTATIAYGFGDQLFTRLATQGCLFRRHPALARFARSLV